MCQKLAILLAFYFSAALFWWRWCRIYSVRRDVLGIIPSRMKAIHIREHRAPSPNNVLIGAPLIWFSYILVWRERRKERKKLHSFVVLFTLHLYGKDVQLFSTSNSREGVGGIVGKNEEKVKFSGIMHELRRIGRDMGISAAFISKNCSLRRWE